MKSKQEKSAFVEWALSQDWLRGQFVSLLDVGSSGGIDKFWRQFEPHLEALGFDPLIAEVNKLSSGEKNKRVHYEAGWVGDGTARTLPSGGLYGFPATSASEAARISQRNYVQTHFNSGQEVVYSDRQLTLDTFLAGRDPNRYDVLKVDTDGFDFFVLEGAKDLLAEGKLLLVECECQMHEVRPGWPCFADIDQFMRRAGYRLVGLDSWTYTRACLPGRFLYDIHAQTERGQIQFSDALYMLDPSQDSTAMDRLSSDASKLAKLVILQAAFGYPDLAVATLLEMRKQNIIPARVRIDDALDRLVPANPFGATTYRSYVELFELDPDSFLASRWDRANHHRRPAASANSTSNKAAPHKPSASANSISDIRLDLLRTNGDWRTNGARLEPKETGTMVVTPSAAWHYTAVAPLGRLSHLLPQEGHLFLRVHLRDVQGNPTISLYHAQSNTLHGEIEVALTNGSQVVDLLIDPTVAHAPDHVLIRNGGLGGPSCLTLERLELVTINEEFEW